MRALLAGFMLVCTAATVQAAEGERPSLAVLVVPAPGVQPGDAAPVRDELHAAAFGHSGAALAWRLVLVAPDGAERSDVGMEEIEKLVAEGKKAYRYLKLDAARTTFQEAAAVLEQAVPVRCNPGTFADMYFYWARARLDSGDDEGAGELLARVQRFDPKAGPDPATMPPNLVATWDLALGGLRARPEVEVAVSVGPGTGTLFVDCFQKPAPATLRGRAGQGLWLGAIVDRGTFRGRFAYPAEPGHTLQVFSGGPGDVNRIQDALQKVSDLGLTVSSLVGNRNEPLDRAARGLGVDALLVAELREIIAGKAVRLGLYLPGRGVVGAIQDVPLRSDGRPEPGRLREAIDALADVARGPSFLVAASTNGTPPPPEAGAVAAGGGETDLREDHREEDRATPWYESWWFWTAAGAVVAGGVVTGVVLGTAGGGSSPSGRVILTIDPL